MPRIGAAGWATARMNSELLRERLTKHI